MERMINLARALDDERLIEKIEQLEEENKNLKLIQETNEKQIQNDIKERDELREENKKLKEKVGTLELWLDNKEKLNGEYRKLIQKIDQLEEENENLRKDLFHLTNDGQRKNPTATQGAEGVIREGGEEQGKNARDS